MAERHSILSGRDLFLNYIDHGGPIPLVADDNCREAQQAVTTALSRHRSFRQRQLNNLRSAIATTQMGIKNTFLTEASRPKIVAVLSCYPAWALRIQVVGECLEGVIGDRLSSPILVSLLAEAASLSMRPRRGGPAGTRTQNQ